MTSVFSKVRGAAFAASSRYFLSGLSFVGSLGASGLMGLLAVSPSHAQMVVIQPQPQPQVQPQGQGQQQGSSSPVMANQSVVLLPFLQFLRTQVQPALADVDYDGQQLASDVERGRVSRRQVAEDVAQLRARFVQWQILAQNAIDSHPAPADVFILLSSFYKIRSQASVAVEALRIRGMEFDVRFDDLVLFAGLTQGREFMELVLMRARSDHDRDQGRQGGGKPFYPFRLEYQMEPLTDRPDRVRLIPHVIGLVNGLSSALTTYPSVEFASQTLRRKGLQFGFEHYAMIQSFLPQSERRFFSIGNRGDWNEQDRGFLRLMQGDAQRSVLEMEFRGLFRDRMVPLVNRSETFLGLMQSGRAFDAVAQTMMSIIQDPEFDAQLNAMGRSLKAAPTRFNLPALLQQQYLGIRSQQDSTTHMTAVESEWKTSVDASWEYTNQLQGRALSSFVRRHLVLAEVAPLVGLLRGFVFALPGPQGELLDVCGALQNGWTVEKRQQLYFKVAAALERAAVSENAFYQSSVFEAAQQVARQNLDAIAARRRYRFASWMSTGARHFQKLVDAQNLSSFGGQGAHNAEAVDRLLDDPEGFNGIIPDVGYVAAAMADPSVEFFENEVPVRNQFSPQKWFAEVVADFAKKANKPAVRENPQMRVTYGRLGGLLESTDHTSFPSRSETPGWRQQFSQAARHFYILTAGSSADRVMDRGELQRQCARQSDHFFDRFLTALCYAGMDNVLLQYLTRANTFYATTGGQMRQVILVNPSGEVARARQLYVTAAAQKSALEERLELALSLARGPGATGGSETVVSNSAAGILSAALSLWNLTKLVDSSDLRARVQAALDGVFTRENQMDILPSSFLALDVLSFDSFVTNSRHTPWIKVFFHPRWQVTQQSLRPWFYHGEGAKKGALFRAYLTKLKDSILESWPLLGMRVQPPTFLRSRGFVQPVSFYQLAQGIFAASPSPAASRRILAQIDSLSQQRPLPASLLDQPANVSLGFQHVLLSGANTTTSQHDSIQEVFDAEEAPISVPEEHWVQEPKNFHLWGAVLADPSLDRQCRAAVDPRDCKDREKVTRVLMSLLMEPFLKGSVLAEERSLDLLLSAPLRDDSFGRIHSQGRPHRILTQELGTGGEMVLRDYSDIYMGELNERETRVNALRATNSTAYQAFMLSQFSSTIQRLGTGAHLALSILMLAPVINQRHLQYTLMRDYIRNYGELTRLNGAQAWYDGFARPVDFQGYYNRYSYQYGELVQSLPNEILWVLGAAASSFRLGIESTVVTTARVQRGRVRQAQTQAERHAAVMERQRSGSGGQGVFREDVRHFGLSPDRPVSQNQVMSRYQQMRRSLEVQRAEAPETSVRRVQADAALRELDTRYENLRRVMTENGMWRAELESVDLIEVRNASGTALPGATPSSTGAPHNGPQLPAGPRPIVSAERLTAEMRLWIRDGGIPHGASLMEVQNNLLAVAEQQRSYLNYLRGELQTARQRAQRLLLPSGQQEALHEGQSLEELQGAATDQVAALERQISHYEGNLRSLANVIRPMIDVFRQAGNRAVLPAELTSDQAELARAFRDLGIQPGMDHRQAMQSVRSALNSAQSDPTRLQALQAATRQVQAYYGRFDGAAPTSGAFQPMKSFVLAPNWIR